MPEPTIEWASLDAMTVDVAKNATCAVLFAGRCRYAGALRRRAQPDTLSLVDDWSAYPDGRILGAVQKKFLVPIRKGQVTLVQKTPANAVGDFGDGTLDWLCLDTTKVEATVLATLNAYLSKLTVNGRILVCNYDQSGVENAVQTFLGQHANVELLGRTKLSPIGVAMRKTS